MEKLSEEQIEQHLENLPEWSHAGDTIQRTFTFEDFPGSMAFVNRVADHAEAVQHHPDILIRYSKVTLTLSTHDAGGLTEKDLAFADAADSMVEVVTPAKK